MCYREKNHNYECDRQKALINNLRAENRKLQREMTSLVEMHIDAETTWNFQHAKPVGSVDVDNALVDNFADPEYVKNVDFSDIAVRLVKTLLDREQE